MLCLKCAYCRSDVISSESHINKAEKCPHCGKMVLVKPRRTVRMATPPSAWARVKTFFGGPRPV